jgi:hypothetical protein
LEHAYVAIFWGSTTIVRLLFTGLEAEWTSTHVAGEQNDQKGAMVSTADANEVLAHQL